MRLRAQAPGSHITKTILIYCILSRDVQYVLEYMAEGGSVLYDINETILYETLFEAVVRRDRLVRLVYGRIRTRLPYDDTRLRQYLRQRDDMDMEMVISQSNKTLTTPTCSQ